MRRTIPLDGDGERTGHADLDSNVMTLLPNEVRVIGVAWHGIPAPERRLRLSAWSVDERIVTVDG